METRLTNNSAMSINSPNNGWAVATDSAGLICEAANGLNK